MSRNALINELRAIVGEPYVLVEKEDVIVYEQDGSILQAMPEIVDDGLTGLLVPPADAAALVEVLERLLAAPSRARRMGDLGRARVLARFTWALVAQRLSGLLLASVRKAHTARLPPAWDTRATRSLSRSEH